jgi:hypothetical protein
VLPADCGEFPFTSAAQFTLHSIATRRRPASAEALDESSELEQIRHTEERTLLAHHQLRIRSNEVGPLYRNRADGCLVHPQQQASARAIVPLTYANELLSTQWMKRVRHANKARRSDRSLCILD